MSLLCLRKTPINVKFNLKLFPGPNCSIFYNTKMDILFNIQSLEDLTNVLGDVIKSLNNAKFVQKSSLDPNTIRNIKKYIIKQITDSNFVLENVKENLMNKGRDQQKVEILMNTLEENKTDLLYNTLLVHYSNYGETVTDFNWVLKLVMGTSDLKSLRYPLLQLVLQTIGNGESKQRTYDVDKEMLAKIIELLETIQ